MMTVGWLADYRVQVLADAGRDRFSTDGIKAGYFGYLHYDGDSIYQRQNRNSRWTRMKSADPSVSTGEIIKGLINSQLLADMD